MLFSQSSRAVGVFPSPQAVGEGFDRLALAGFPLAKVFLVGQDLSHWEKNGKVVRPAQVVDQAQTGAIAGSALGLKQGLVAGNILGGATGILLGMGILALPGVGQIALTSAIAFTLLSGGICTAAGGVIGALIGLGLTEQQVKEYSQQLARGNYLLIVNGTAREIKTAEKIIGTHHVRR